VVARAGAVADATFTEMLEPPTPRQRDQLHALLCPARLSRSSSSGTFGTARLPIGVPIVTFGGLHGPFRGRTDILGTTF
jgi:hypothetical protein